MVSDFLIKAPVGLLPVLIFLLLLQYMDSYKLVKLRTILYVILAGGLVVLVGSQVNGYLMELLNLDFTTYARYAAPLIEESLKATVMIYLFRSNRIGFLVDAAILGFAVGTGFAVFENLYYLYLVPEANVGVWIVRGFGTAIMHGGVMAVFGVLSQTLTERNMKINPFLYLPGLLVAGLVHSVFNHFPGTPILTTLVTLMTLPLMLWLVYQRSARVMHTWLEVDFDQDALLLEQINSGKFTETRIGLFLEDLKCKI